MTRDIRAFVLRPSNLDILNLATFDFIFGLHYKAALLQSITTQGYTTLINTYLFTVLFKLVNLLHQSHFKIQHFEMVCLQL